MPVSPDQTTFAEFAGARSAALYRFCYLLVGDRGLAEDLLQESLVKTYVKWRKLRAPAAAEAYTRRVITTTAISWWRRKAWHAERPRDDVPELDIGGYADDVDQRTWLWGELQRLPARQRAAVVLRYYEDLTETQTAEAMGCTVGTVKSQVHAALRKLRDQLGTDVVLENEEMVTR
jgi:RNA polymerase sigma-70 factor (sigma-E family)